MIALVSLWRNDADRNLEERAYHLMEKTSRSHAITLVWGVGDSADDTAAKLREYAQKMFGEHWYLRVRIVDIGTGIMGEDLDSRRRRLGESATILFSKLPNTQDLFGPYTHVVLHESDLLTDHYVVDHLFNAAEGAPCAGWPVIDIGNGKQFYDIWAYRHLNGRYFTPDEQAPRSLIRVLSFGSVWIAPIDMVAGRTLDQSCIKGLCAQWTQEGHHLYCDPSIVVVQPRGLWEMS